MEQPVEVAAFTRGELKSLRFLSGRSERRAVIFAAAVPAVVVLLGMAMAALVVSSLDLVVHAPTFALSWALAAVAVGVVSGRRARARARRYSVGVRIDDDAFGAVDVDLVTRQGASGDYDLGLVPGMAGTIDHGRVPLAVEALTRAGAVRVPLPAAGKVCIDFGPSTFVIQRRPEAPEDPSGLAERLRRRAEAARRLLPAAAAAVPIAALATLLGAVPAALALGEGDMRSAIPANATQWEVEQHIRTRAQRQAGALHRCFDPLPLRCQRGGFVGVGLSLGRDGEVRRHWVSRTTYTDCPVSACMADVAASWFFEPMPAPMNLVLPIQVRRTSKPLYDPRPLIAHPVTLIDPSAGDAGALEASLK